VAFERSSLDVGSGASGRPPRASARSVAGARRRARWLDAVLALIVVLIVGVWLSRFGGAFGGPVPVTSRLHG
jgi:hypothetical protein